MSEEITLTLPDGSVREVPKGSTPLDVARTLPRRSQELLGYMAHDAIAAGGGYLGAVDLLDPIELIAQGKL